VKHRNSQTGPNAVGVICATTLLTSFATTLCGYLHLQSTCCINLRLVLHLCIRCNSCPQLIALLSSLMSYINFHDRVNMLREYKKRTGHLSVSLKDDKSLYNWCRDIRCAKRNTASRKNKLTADRIAALDAIRFDWRIHNTRTKKSNPIVPNSQRSQLAQAPTLTSTLSTNYDESFKTHRERKKLTTIGLMPTVDA
jgi:hypothetical protein